MRYPFFDEQTNLYIEKEAAKPDPWFTCHGGSPLEDRDLGILLCGASCLPDNMQDTPSRLEILKNTALADGNPADATVDSLGTFRMEMRKNLLTNLPLLVWTIYAQSRHGNPAERESTYRFTFETLKKAVNLIKLYNMERGGSTATTIGIPLTLGYDRSCVDCGMIFNVVIRNFFEVKKQVRLRFYDWG